MHYDLDWSHRTRVTSNCDTAIEHDPCFATFACVCDNEYFRIAENMPTMPSDYSGYRSIIANALTEEVDASAAGNNDSGNVGVLVEYVPPEAGAIWKGLEFESTTFSDEPTTVVERAPGIDYEWPDDDKFFWDQFEMWQWVAIFCGIFVCLMFTCYGYSKCCCRSPPE